MVTRAKRGVLSSVTAWAVIMVVFAPAGVAGAAADVTCSVPGDLQSTIDSATPGASVTFSGVCEGAISIDKDLVLAGVPGAVIDASGSGQTAVTVAADTTVAVTVATIRGGDAIAGGGVANMGVLMLDRVTVTGNHAVRGGGIANLGVLMLVGSHVSGNQADANGGGVHAASGSNITIVDTDIDANQSQASGGGVWVGELGTLTAVRTTVSDNVAGGDGGGIFAQQATLDLQSVVLRRNAAGSGGGMYLLAGEASISSAEIEDNQVGSPAGGAGFVFDDGTVELTDSSVADNATIGAGGGGQVRGGAADIEIHRSSFVGNLAGGGGAIALVAGSLNVVNSTLSGNEAARGGAIHSAGPDSRPTIVAATITDNTATATGGGLEIVGNPATLTGTILAGNSAPSGPDCITLPDLVGTGLPGSVASGGNNLVGAVDTCVYAAHTGDLIGSAALLGPLLDLGGSPSAHLPAATSPAVDHIPPDECPVAVDQRNVPRPQEAGCDIGAIELTTLGATACGLTDVVGSVFEDDVCWIHRHGITRGCNPPANTRFCPDDLVTRGQMAAFLVRALDLADDGGGNHFTDDNGSEFEGDIARLAAAGITRGCNPPANTRFCPDDLVTRGQMAAFLHRALTLP
jgi:predicted outer membrane repeat protein